MISTTSSKHPHPPVHAKLAQIKGENHFSTNPQRSSSSQVTSKKKKGNPLKMMKDTQVCGKINGNVHKLLKSEELINPQDIHGHSQGCEKQVYSSISVAESTAAAMLKMGFLKEAHVEKCAACRLIHIREVRKWSNGQNQETGSKRTITDSSGERAAAASNAGRL